MIRYSSIIKIIILVGLTAFIVIGWLNFSRYITQTKVIKNIDKAKLSIVVKNDEIKELQKEKISILGKSNQEIENKSGNKHEEIIENKKNNEENSSVPDRKTDTFFLTYNELKSLEKVSFGDKLFGMMLISKIKSVNINEIWALAKGGITTTEAVELEKILEKDLKKKDIDKIYSLLKRNMGMLASK